jgi:cysteine desulfurase
VIYLDNNATTRPTPAVAAAVAGALTDTWCNPSSVYRAGQAARRTVELARESIASLVGTDPKHVTFTSGGTEAIDLAIRGTLLASRTRRIVTTAVEHAAVRDLCASLFKRGVAEVVCAPTDRNGILRRDTLDTLIDESVALVSVQWANNETGAVQPVGHVAELCRARGVVFHCDATQWVGKVPVRFVDAPRPHTGPTPPDPVNLARLGALEPILAPDLLTFAPHKFHGPKGVGVLMTRPGTRLAPTLIGTQERDRRGGTENVPGIAGAGAAAQEALLWLNSPAWPAAAAALAALRDHLESALLAAFPGSEVNGPRDHRRLWNTTNIAFPRLEAEAILLAMSELGVCASAGAACSSGSLDPSPVLLAMGVPPELAHGSIRFSLARDTTIDEIDRALPLIVQAVRRVAGSLR